MYLYNYAFTLTIPSFLNVHFWDHLAGTTSKRTYGKMSKNDQTMFMEHIIYTSGCDTHIEFYLEETPTSETKHLHAHGIISFDDIQNFDKWRSSLFAFLRIKAAKQQNDMLNYSEVNSHFWAQYMKKQHEQANLIDCPAATNFLNSMRDYLLEEPNLDGYMFKGKK